VKIKDPAVVLEPEVKSNGSVTPMASTGARELEVEVDMVCMLPNFITSPSLMVASCGA